MSAWAAAISTKVYPGFLQSPKANSGIVLRSGYDRFLPDPFQFPLRESSYCHEFMTPWLIITGSGLDDWIYWQLLLQSLVITINYKNSPILFRRTLLPWLPRARPILILVLRLPDFWSTKTDSYILSARTTYRKHSSSIVACVLRFPRDRYPASPLARWILLSNGLGANHIENTNLYCWPCVCLNLYT
jgi:hypothetical protein